jgi:hypothetical protein
MSKTRVQTQSKRSSNGTHRRDFEKVHSSRSEARNVEGVERNGEGRSRQARIDEELERQRPVQSGRNFSKLRGEGPSRPNSRKESEVGYEKSKGNSDGRHEAALYKGGQSASGTSMSGGSADGGVSLDGTKSSTKVRDSGAYRPASAPTSHSAGMRGSARGRATNNPRSDRSSTVRY